MSSKRFIPPKSAAAQSTDRVGDRRDASFDYVYDERGRIALAVGAARASHRPLLLRGEPGTGKSSLARAVARALGWRYYEDVISSRTQARDLLWHVDAVRRLADAQATSAAKIALKPDAAYVDPGVLWWAFDPTTAHARGVEPGAVEPAVDPNLEKSQHLSAVVLLDEIDKADPEVPNDLLVPLGSFQFLRDGKLVAKSEDREVLVFLTTNNERELPPAFLRRCLVLEMPELDAERLVAIAVANLGDAARERAQQLVEAWKPLRKAADTGERTPSTPEFLDALRVSLDHEILVGSEEWKELVKLTWTKQVG